MSQRIKLSQKPTLEETIQAFFEWRKTRHIRSKIPNYLWNAAISLLGKHSINHICKTLHLSHSDLKKRFQVAKTDLSSPSRPRPAFVELNVTQPLPPKGSVIEMENPAGFKMRMQIQGEASSLLLELGKLFMEGRR